MRVLFISLIIFALVMVLMQTIRNEAVKLGKMIEKNQAWNP
jgi:hypothetical protein